MFYLAHPLIICTSFLLFVSAIARGKGVVLVRWCKRVESPYVKEGTLYVPAPEVVCFYVKSGKSVSIAFTVLLVFSHQLHTHISHSPWTAVAVDNIVLVT